MTDQAKEVVQRLKDAWTFMDDAADTIDELIVENTYLKNKLKEAIPYVEEAARRIMALDAEDTKLRLDAERYRWLAGHCRSTSEHWRGRWSIIVDGPAPETHDSEDDFDTAIDAARAAFGVPHAAD